jgi:hypothetical protein
MNALAADYDGYEDKCDGVHRDGAGGQQRDSLCREFPVRTSGLEFGVPLRLSKTWEG